jgi:RNA polymerase sigma-70 factor (ECF subfamily)
MAEWHGVLEEVMRERGGRLVGYASLLVGPSASEDLVQDALIRSFSRGRGFPNANAAESYVRRTMATMSIDSWRRLASRRRREGRSVAEPFAPVPSDDVDARVDVIAALARLAPRIRACVVLRFYDDLTVHEIADQLGIAEGTVKRDLFDAVSVLSAEFAVDLGAGTERQAPVVAAKASVRDGGGKQ